MTMYYSTEMIKAHPATTVIESIESFMQEELPDAIELQAEMEMRYHSYMIMREIDIPVLIELELEHEYSLFPIPYVNRFHPLKSCYRRPYWMRTRSNPTRRNYH